MRLVLVLLKAGVLVMVVVREGVQGRYGRLRRVVELGQRLRGTAPVKPPRLNKSSYLPDDQYRSADRPGADDSRSVERRPETAGMTRSQLPRRQSVSRVGESRGERSLLAVVLVPL